MLTDTDIYRAAQMYISGKSLRKIGAILNVDYEKVVLAFKNKLPLLNNDLSIMVNNILENNTPNSIKDPDVVKRILTTYRDFVEKGMSAREISENLNVSVDTVWSDLKTKIYTLHTVVPDIVTEEMVTKTRDALKNHSLANSKKKRSAA